MAERFESGKLQEVLDQAVHALCLLVDDLGKMMRKFWLLKVLGGKCFGKAGNRGQRCTELMGGVADEFSLPLIDFLCPDRETASKKS